jgi:hypothetical protein
MVTSLIISEIKHWMTVMTQAILAQLLIAVRGVTESFDVVEELASPCIAQTGENFFLSVYETMMELDLPCTKLKEVTTNEAPSMTGNKTGMMGRINREMYQQNPDLYKELHCYIHQHSLCETCCESCAIGCKLHSTSRTYSSPASIFLSEIGVHMGTSYSTQKSHG